ncbi:MAG TPA: transposase, partial [Candidatus Bathyarchaeia archaeon]|nr:transposase [Candidatus Bathyarchaeia archaeon]
DGRGVSSSASAFSPAPLSPFTPVACAAIKATGAQIWPLPPYSHDLNPIEKMWSKIKAYLRKTKARDPESLYQAVGRAMARVSQRDVRNWFASCGYSFI